MRSKGVFQWPQQKKDAEKISSKKKEKVNDVSSSPNLAPIIKTTAENKSLNPLNFSFKFELNKIKIPVPLLELLKNPAYRESFKYLLQPSLSPNSVNIEDVHPTIFLGSHAQDQNDDNSPPFYLSLNIHHNFLHNYLLDYGASYNLMPKKVMDELGLKITKQYHDLYTFESKRVKCLGVIKDLVISLTQLPMKSLVIDIVVPDIPSRFGILLSRSWSKNWGALFKWI